MTGVGRRSRKGVPDAQPFAHVVHGWHTENTTEGIVVILALVASQDALDAGADHLQKRVLGKVRVAGIIERLGKSSGQADAVIELADGKQPGITGELARRWLDHQLSAEEV